MSEWDAIQWDSHGPVSAHYWKLLYMASLINLAASSLPKQCSSDLSLVSNEPPRWLLKKTKKTGTSSLSHSIFHFPLTQTKETLLCSNSHDAPMLHLFILLMSCPGVPQTTRAFLSFSNTFIFLYPFFSCHLFLFFHRSPALALFNPCPSLSLCLCVPQTGLNI